MTSLRLTHTHYTPEMLGGVCLVSVCMLVQRPEEGVAPGLEVTGNGELPRVGAGKQAWVLWKSSI